MASYNREFLLPYLQNLCALELVNFGFFAKSHKSQKKIEAFQKELSNNPKPYPMDIPILTKGRIASLIVGTLLLCIAIGGYIINAKQGEVSSTDNLAQALLYGIVGWLFWIGAVKCFISAAREARYEEKEYYPYRLKEYEKTEAKNKKIREQELPAAQQEKQQWDAEFERSDALLKQLYSVNIIPRKYRDIHAIAYLYDLFSTSRADDIDAALERYDPNKLEDELTELIDNKTELFIKQRVASAMEEKLGEAQPLNEILQAKLAQMTVSENERNLYQCIIDTNAVASEYFATTKCIRR